ncbi:MAG: hypothetical protein GY820_31725 [Gammaproteobacteria bacterium]|nr:hypothetical protein [Gammaproteobacteria bacterium]
MYYTLYSIIININKRQRGGSTTDPSRLRADSAKVRQKFLFVDFGGPTAGPPESSLSSAADSRVRSSPRQFGEPTTAD